MKKRLTSLSIAGAVVAGAVTLSLSAGCEQRVVKTTGLGSDQVHPTRYESNRDDTFMDWFKGEPEDQ